MLNVGIAHSPKVCLVMCQDLRYTEDRYTLHFLGVSGLPDSIFKIVTLIVAQMIWNTKQEPC